MKSTIFGRRWVIGGVSLLVALVFVAANILSEKSLEPGRTHYLAYLFLLACLAFLGFRWCCQQFGLAIASAVVDSLLTLLTVAYAIFVLKERLNPIQYAGIVLLLLGILLVKGPFSGPKLEKLAPKRHTNSASADQTSARTQ